jgi:hypothetical protein
MSEEAVGCGLWAVGRSASRFATTASSVLMFMTFAATWSHADPLFDPMRPPTATHPSASAPREYGPRVSAIFFSGLRRVAVFDGHVVKVGDRVGDVTIREISADGVRYSRAGQVEFARLPTQAAIVRRDAAGVEEGQ